MELYTYHPCRNTPGIEGIEECKPEEAEFWGVYRIEGVGHLGTELRIVGDAVKEQDAKAFVDELNGAYQPGELI